MRSFDKIGVEIVIGKYGASHRRNTDGLMDQVHFFQHLCHQSVSHAVCAARAVVGGHIGKCFGSFVYEIVWSSHYAVILVSQDSLGSV